MSSIRVLRSELMGREQKEALMRAQSAFMGNDDVPDGENGESR